MITPDLTPEGIADLVARLRIKGPIDREKINHAYRRNLVERVEAAKVIESLAARATPAPTDNAALVEALTNLIGHAD